MPRDNSYEEFILGLYDAQLKDCTLQYPGLAGEFDRDLSRLRSALECHGIHFFLDVMPAYRKHFDKCLDERRLTRTPLIHFGSWKCRGGMVPRLFRGLTLRVFELTGELRDQPDLEAIRWIRQLLGVVRKLRLTSDLKHRCEAVDEFFQVDGSVSYENPQYWDSHTPASEVIGYPRQSFADLVTISDDTIQETDDNSQASEEDSSETLLSTHLKGVADVCQHVADILSSTLGVFNPYEWRTKHGPGSVSDQLFGNYRYKFRSWPERLELVFPYADFAFANYGIWADEVGVQDSPSVDETAIAACMHAVPKTLSKPRLIASEPACLQWCQQAIRDYMYTRVSETFISKFVDFRRQDLNGSLALSASHSQSHVTIDLSSASDRISCDHVLCLFRHNHDLLDALRATRSKWIRQDISRTSPSLYQVRKYSTMGNATTFPVQTLLFLTIALGSLLYVRGLKPTIANLTALDAKTVRIFGDDMIVPKDVSWCTLAMLKAFSMKVNTSKTFVTGKFRESCGVDAYDGHDVTTINVLDMPRQASPGSVVSSVDVHHNLLTACCWNTAEYLRKMVEQCGYDNIRTVKHRSGLFGWSDMGIHTPARLKSRWNNDLSCREVRCLCLTTKVQRITTVESGGLLQFFTEAANKVTSAVSTLGFLARRPKVQLGLRWARI